MSNLIVSTEPREEFNGIAKVIWDGRRGMISLRGSFDDPKFVKALETAWGFKIPAPLNWSRQDLDALAWMSPDELMLFCEYDVAQERLDAFEKAAAGLHFLAVNVSDARSVFRVSGDMGRDVLSKLTPTDLRPAQFEDGAFRRTRIAQIPAAIGLLDDTFTIMCFRSVGQYGLDLLKTSAQTGGEVHYH